MSEPRRPRTPHELLQEQVTDLLKATGWRWLHVRRSIGKGRKWVTTTNVKGWPDLAPMWNRRQPGRCLALELKVPPDWLREDQGPVLEELSACGFEAFVVVPNMRRLGVVELPAGVFATDVDGLARVLQVSPNRRG